MAMYDVSIRNGRLGRPGGVVSADVAISGSRTVCLGNPGNEEDGHKFLQSVRFLISCKSWRKEDEG
jgi:hypothetical protein